jgi:hypothetical protein
MTIRAYHHSEGIKKNDLFIPLQHTEQTLHQQRWLEQQL